MKLSGLDRITAKPAGGIVSVEMVRASCFKRADYDRSEGCFTLVETHSPFATYVFREDRATYIEEFSGTAGRLSVKHTLKMEFPCAPETDKAMDELAGLSGEGFVAVITTGTGERLLSGYSSRFGTLYPLRLAKIVWNSASHPSDFPSVSVVFESEDSDRSKSLRN